MYANGAGYGFEKNTGTKNAVTRFEVAHNKAKIADAEGDEEGAKKYRDAVNDAYFTALGSEGYDDDSYYDADGDYHDVTIPRNKHEGEERDRATAPDYKKSLPSFADMLAEKNGFEKGWKEKVRGAIDRLNPNAVREVTLTDEEIEERKNKEKPVAFDDGEDIDL